MRRFAALAGGVVILLALAQAIAAQPAPSPAAVALFETPHLANLRGAVNLDYTFRREEDGKPTIEDRITMAVGPELADGRHDVQPEFLTGARHIAYPIAHGFRGNPLLMFALDRDARELAAATGGGLQWFRSRIRQALVDGATLSHTQLVLPRAAAPVAAIEIAMTPFQGEPRARRYQQRQYVFVLAEAVPGGIAEIRTILPAGDDGGRVVETITFAGTRP